MEHGSLMPALLLLIFLFAFAALFVWWTLRQSSELEQMTQEGMQAQQQFRQWRNRRAEEEMVLMLKELGWPKAVKKMTAEEVAHQLCNRLAVRLRNRPNVR